MIHRMYVMMRLVLCLLSIASVQSLSAWMVKIPFPELVKASDHIVMGKITGMRSFWSEDRKLILTQVTVCVDDCIKGSSPLPECVITHVGGVVGEVGLWQSDTPVFKRGERVVVFLQPDHRGTYKVTGQVQGKFTIKDYRVIEGDMAVGEFVKHIETIVRSR